MNYRRVWVLGLVLLAAAPAWAQEATVPPVAPVPEAPPSVWVPPGYPPPPPGYLYVPLSQVQLVKPKPPAYLHYTEGEPVPEGYHLKHDFPRGLMIAGGVVGGACYGLSALVASDSTDNAKGFLFIPVLGPWLTLGLRKYGRSTQTSANDTEDFGVLRDAGAVMVLFIDGMLQVAGGAAVVMGLTNKRKTLVRDKLSWSLSPNLAGKGYGLSAVGTF